MSDITVIGEALIDVIVDPTGHVSTSVVGGAPLNTARTLARLGIATSFLGGVSTDAFGERIMRLLAEDGVQYALGAQVASPTTLAIAQLDRDGAATYRFMMEKTSACDVTPERGLAAVPEDTKVIHAGTLGLVLEPLAHATMAVVAASPPERIVMIDPNCRPSVMTSSDVFDRTLAAVMQRADIIKVSGDDLAFMFPGVASMVAARRVQKSSGAAVLFTDGANAVHVMAAGGERRLDVPRVPVVDTVGAGDSFSGGFLAWWLKSKLDRTALSELDLLEQAAKYGIAVAGITCQRPGADPPHAADLAR